MRALLFWLCLVLPATAQSSLYLNFSQNQVEGGSTLEGMVASNVPAPAEGFMVLLTAGTGLSLPDRVFIAPGQKAARFPIESQPVARNCSVQVRAQIGGVVGTNLVHLTPVGEQIARNPPPTVLVTSNQASYGFDYGYGYGYNGYGYGYGYNGYGYGYNGYGDYGRNDCRPSNVCNETHRSSNLPANWPAGSDGMPAGYPVCPR